VPNHFIVLDVNTPPPWDECRGKPRELRDRIESTVEAFDGSLRAGPYFDIGKKVGYVVIKGPDDPAKAKAMIDALPTLKATVMLRISEMEAAAREAERADG
jgi:hypothetical protein